jgi:hypothetical protein
MRYPLMFYFFRHQLQIYPPITNIYEELVLIKLYPYRALVNVVKRHL